MRQVFTTSAALAFVALILLAHSTIGCQKDNPVQKQSGVPPFGLLVPASFELSCVATDPRFECIIPIKNQSAYPQLLEVGKLNCGCLKAQLSSDKLEPGQSGHVQLEIDSPFSFANEAQWLGEISRETTVTVSASSIPSSGAINYSIPVKVSFRSAIRIGDSHTVILDVGTEAKKGEESAIPISLEPNVRVLSARCDDPRLATKLSVNLARNADGGEALRCSFLSEVTSNLDVQDSHVVFELASAGSKFLERIPLRFTRRRPVTMEPKSIVLKRYDAPDYSYGVTFSSSTHTIKAISNAFEPHFSDGEVTVHPGSSTNCFVVQVKPPTVGVLNQFVTFSVVVHDKNGESSIENIRLPIVGSH